MFDLNLEGVDSFMHKSSPEFIDKLHSLLEDPQLSAYIKWTPSGTSFIINDPPEFARVVLETAFKHGNLSSFVRQLNKYDFHKVKTDGCNMWEFKNEYFQRGRHDLMRKIKRKRSSSERTIQTDTPTDAHLLHAQAVSTLKVITRYFQVVIEDIAELKSLLQGKKTLRKVLIVDDTTSQRIAQAVSQANAQPVVTDSEDEAFVRIETERFDCYVFGPKSASILVRKARSVNQRAKIIVLIDAQNKMDGYSLLGLGASEIVVRPYMDETLIHVIRTCLDSDN